MPQKPIRWPKAPPQVDRIQTGLVFQRIVSIDADLDKVLEDAIHIAAAMIDHRQTVAMALVDHGLDAGLEVLAPEAGREEHAFLVSHVAPDNDARQSALHGLDLCAENAQVELMQARNEAGDSIGILAHPQHHVFCTQNAPNHLVGLAHAAIDGKIFVLGGDTIDERCQISFKAVAHAIDLVVAGTEKAALIERIVKLECLHLFDCVRVEGDKGRHGQVESLADGGSETRVDRNFIFVVTKDFELLDVRIHIRRYNTPVEIVVAVDVGVRSQVQFAAPTAEETAPEEIADRHAVRLLVVQRLIHPIQLGDAVCCSFHGLFFPASRNALGHGRDHALVVRESPFVA